MNVSFLFAAGFSKPAGYPIARDVSNLMLRVQASGIAVHTDGQVWLRPEFIDYLRGPATTAPFEEIQDAFNWDDRPAKAALEAVLEAYSQQHPLTDYEHFYDELIAYQVSAFPLRIAPAFVTAYQKRGLHDTPGRENDQNHLHQALRRAQTIFVQLLSSALKPDPTTATPGAGAAYGKLMQLLSTYGQSPRGWLDAPSSHQFFLHTLNHDLFLEGMLRSDFTGVDYSDGFEEAGSPFYGRIEFNSDFPRYMQQWPPYAFARIPQYTGQYKKPVQLVKLHGSLDYWGFSVEGSYNGLYEPQILRVQPWIDPISLYREVERDGELKYVNDFTNYHAQFLTGATAKKQQYDDPVLFKPLLTRFEHNLGVSDLLVIIGYGFRDEGINDRILPFLQNPDKRTIVIGRDKPVWFKAIQDDMFRTGGLEGYDFSELEKMLSPQ